MIFFSVLFLIFHIVKVILLTFKVILAPNRTGNYYDDINNLAKEYRYTVLCAYCWGLNI